MKRIISLLCVACLVLITACSDDKEVGPIFDSVLTPDFTFDDGAEIIAGVDAVQFTDNSTAKGTEISGYFWHFGFAGLGNWSEEAAPDPVMYKEAGEYVVTLTVYGADGNSSSTKRTIVVKAANLAPSASFTYTPETVVVDTEVTLPTHRSIPMARSSPAGGPFPIIRPLPKLRSNIPSRRAARSM